MKTQPMKSLKFVLCLLGCLVMASTAQAASFDCAKAQTKVEKLICADAELSRHDEELAAAYKAALKNEKQAESIRQAQKQWIRERNGCSDAGCVKRAYEARLSSLAATHTSTGGGKVSSRFSGQWHFELCDINISNECGGFTVYLIQAGKKICGDHFFATPGGGRLNEGAPRSIIGTIAEGNIANILITSGRNGAVFRVRATEKDDILKWEVIEEIKHGPDGESALVLDKGNLKREKENGSYQAALSACQGL